MILELKGIDVSCIIGDLPDERNRLQHLLVDLFLTIGDRSAESDELEDTVDYAAMTERIRLTLSEAQCRMIERAAKLVLDICAEVDGIHHARVRVTKRGSVPHLESATVEMAY